MLTDAQEIAINSVAHYTIDFEQHEYSDQLEVIAEMTIANDYEQQRGTIFKDPVI